MFLYKFGPIVSIADTLYAKIYQVIWIQYDNIFMKSI
jgi:hypothetical protein